MRLDNSRRRLKGKKEKIKMILYIIFTKYYGESVPLGFTTSKETAKKEKEEHNSYWIEEYNISNNDDNYYEFPDWSM